MYTQLDCNWASSGLPADTRALCISSRGWTRIQENTGPSITASRSSLLLTNFTTNAAGARHWSFDFSKSLLFPIHHIRTVTAAGGSTVAFPGTDAQESSLEVLATEVSGFILTVVTSIAAESVFAEVDSSAFSENFA